MGRKTYESIGRALPGRVNIVITTDTTYQLADAVVVNSIDDAMTQAKDTNTEEVMIIGGGTIYDNLLSNADRLYLTLIDLDVEGDTYFPDYHSAACWNEISSEMHQPDAKNPHAYRFVTLERA